MKNSRPQEIKSAFTKLVDDHLADLEHGRTTEMFEIEVFANKLCIHPTHLSNTIKEATGHSPCGIYQSKILDVAQRLLASSTHDKRYIIMSGF